MIEVDYIIVGQGFAGSFTAFELLERNKSFIVIDHFQQNASSVAAGIFNPIVLKRFAPIWNAQSQIDFFRYKARKLENILQTTLLNEQPVVRIFHDQEEQQIWLDKAKNVATESFLNTDLIPKLPYVEAPYKMGKVNESGRFDAHSFITQFRQYLIELERLLDSTFDYNDLKVENGKVIYKNYSAKHIIFAEGKGVLQNPWFNYLPIYLNKGEVLEVTLDQELEDYIYKKKAFLFQMNNGKYFLGSTYSLTELSNGITEIAKEELLKDCSEFYKGSIEVSNHLFGFRPVTKDRRPMVGQHPELNNAFIINGLGTRGTLLGAYFADQLISFIEDSKAIDEEADIKRYKSLYPKNGH